jgi:hypothetical protein
MTAEQQLALCGNPFQPSLNATLNECLKRQHVDQLVGNTGNFYNVWQ